MKRLKTLYWLILIIGLLSVMASVYLYSQGRPFDTYFAGGMLGLIFAATGYVYLRKLKNYK